MRLSSSTPVWSLFFFFNDTATTEIYTLSLHDALPIFGRGGIGGDAVQGDVQAGIQANPPKDRKSTRLNSSHSQISYAVFCLKKKNTRPRESTPQLELVALAICASNAARTHCFSL